MGKVKLFVTFAMLLLLVCAIAVTSYFVFNQEKDKQFYVGVTYCGSSVEEAKELIDKVKDYTNLFILQSGTLRNIADVEEIGDYAVTSGLSFATYYSYNGFFFSTDDNTLLQNPPDSFDENSDLKWQYGLNNTLLQNPPDSFDENSDISQDIFVDLDSDSRRVGVNEWALAAKERWKEQFIGIYYYDELGGDMLDKSIEFTYAPVKNSLSDLPFTVRKTVGGSMMLHNQDKSISCYPSGEINISYNNTSTRYYPNGTINVSIFSMVEQFKFEFYTSENITECPLLIHSYEEVLKQLPLQTYDDAAELCKYA